MRSIVLSTALALSLFGAASAAPSTQPSVGDWAANVAIRNLVGAMAEENLSSEKITQGYIDRIKALDPALKAVIVINPDALKQARAADVRRGSTGGLGPLDGIPILIKDNIETLDPMATTGGSLALKDNVTGRDAPVVARLRAGGAVILGKTNLSEWANLRSSRSISGWSGVGGQTRNPYDPARSACGSSAGSGAAVAAGFAAAALGTETDGSITCPAAVNGLVGLKPTVGLISRSRIIPISETQDTPGPMTRTVEDAAILLGVIAGSDPADPATKEADAHRRDYAAGLRADALKGVRIGVMRYAAGFHPETDAAFERALQILRDQGAVLIDIKDFPEGDAMGEAEYALLLTELKSGLNAYLATTDPKRVKTRTLEDLIAFNTAHADQELALFGQEAFVAAQKTTGLADPAYLKAKAQARKLAAGGLDAILKRDNLTALVGPTLGPSWLIDPVLRDHYVGGGAGNAAAVAGYPHLTVPMGQVGGLPVGLSFVGPAWSEQTLLAYGYAYEQASEARKPPRFKP